MNCNKEQKGKWDARQNGHSKIGKRCPGARRNGSPVYTCLWYLEDHHTLIELWTPVQRGRESLDLL